MAGAATEAKVSEVILKKLPFLKKWFCQRPDLSGLSLGQAGEEWAAFLYEQKGYQAVARNYAVYEGRKLGELDLVCAKRNELVIVEVKTRRDEKFMGAVEAVHYKKQNYLRRMAKLFIQQNPQFEKREIRIDVVAIVMNPVDNSVKSVNILENAIEDDI